jgi:hypothetical protein
MNRVVRGNVMGNGNIGAVLKMKEQPMFAISCECAKNA